MGFCILHETRPLNFLFRAEDGLGWLDGWLVGGFPFSYCWGDAFLNILKAAYHSHSFGTIHLNTPPSHPLISWDKASVISRLYIDIDGEHNANLAYNSVILRNTA
jgi:hypothetical protein